MEELHCYCATKEKDQFMLQCSTCKKLFHAACLRTGPPSPLTGDVFFNLTCATCAQDGEEACVRIRLQWTQVLMLTLYNLQLLGGGKCGYFRWREHICAFIDKHWITFFGTTKKKTSTWHGTIAGTLSAGCPQYFRSGVQELKESGWWTLVENKPPSLQDLETLMSKKSYVRQKRQPSRSLPESPVKPTGLRTRPNKPAIQAAIELKERRSCIIENKELRRNLTRAEKASVPSLPEWKQPSTSSQGEIETKEFVPLKTNIKEEVADITESDSSAFDWNHSCEESTDSWFTERDLRPDEKLPQFLLKDDETIDVDDIEIDPGSVSPMPMPDSPKVEDLVLSVTGETEEEFLMPSVKQEPPDSGWSSSVESNWDSVRRFSVTQDDADVSDSEEESSETREVRPSKRRRAAARSESQEEEKLDEKIRYIPLSLYEERRMLKSLQKIPQAVEQSAEARRLRRKLLVRQAKRERNLPVFDLDAEVMRLKGQNPTPAPPKDWMFGPAAGMPVTYGGEFRVLDRYHTRAYRVKSRQQQHPSFLTRLVGRDEDHLENIISPYTSRVLKPFIWRDYETIPPKLSLLKEIVAYPNRNDPKWIAPPHSPIDYSYVRPHHIPSVNALCQEFFWPGIDLSECLQYPDFSCVALYRKMVIGFSFMVPDVKCNEAYISFIFTHPEWRKAGIATFMLYHLIQTCMGKDVTLHVSATNPALFLYQKFGFKLEEFILDFYDKYYAEDSRDCKHSFFLRLSR